MPDIRKVTILSDMDGTLVSSDGTVSEKNKEAIRRFIGAGGHFGIATGRGHINLLNYLDGVEINSPSVLYNGGMLYDFKESKAIKIETLINSELMETVKHIEKKYPQVMLHINTPDACHLISKEENADEIILNDHLPLEFSKFESLVEEPWIKVLLAGKNEDLKEIEKELMKLSDHHMRWVYSADIYLEILPSKVTKAAMIGKMKEIHGGDHMIIALGDFYNDVEML
ncbi:MAG TPA: HAD-IIB family hydrolase, partial [Bacteroidales bacterium]|nr:HAD-IIB family hydrolase [Bacteroidales bacterium]